MIEERLMLPGRWSIKLRADTPKTIRDLLVWYGHIYILDDEVDSRKQSDANMKALARYCGIVRRRKTDWDLEGPGPIAWLGNEFGIGDVLETAVALTDARFSAWITALLPAGGSVVAGTLTDPAQLLKEPGFEALGTWFANNAGTGGGTTVDTNPHSGTTNLKLSNPSAGNYGGAYNNTGIPVAGSSKIRVWWWGKANVAGNSGPFRVTFANAGTSVNAQGIATAPPSNQAGVSIVDTTSALTVNYTQFNAIITVPAGFTWAFIEIFGATGAGVSTLTYYDDLVVESLLTQSFGGTAAPATSRTAIDWIIENWYSFQPAYRVNPDFTLDAGPQSVLFKVVPTAVAALRGSRDILFAGLSATTLTADRDVDDYASRILYIAATGTAVASGADTSFKDGRGNNAKLTKVINNSLTPSAMADTEAAAAAAKYVKYPRTQLRISGDEYAITRDARVGDNIYVYDQEQGVVDTTNQIRFQGRTIFPQIWQLVAAIWPVERGMGVYYRDSAGVYTNLTPYIEWETAGAQLEVGAAMRRLT